MKSIGIVVDKNQKLANILKENLLKIFKGFVEINIYYLYELQVGDDLKDDIIMAMTKEKAVALHQFVKNKDKILVINRTITVEAWLKLSKIPKGSTAIVINDNYMTTIEFAEQLYGMLDDLILVPYKFGDLYPREFIVITPGESPHIPMYMQNIFDTGHRVIDSSTFIAMITKLGIDEIIVQKRLLEYLNEIVPLQDGIHVKFRELAAKDQILKSILDNAMNAIVIIGEDGFMKLYNEKFIEYLGIKEEDTYLNFEKLVIAYIKDLDLAQKLIKNKNVISEVYVKDNRYFNITKKSMMEMGFENGILITISEITYIKKLERKLSGKLSQRGQVARYNFKDIKSKSLRMENVIKLAKKIAPSDFEILINGESGTGKELFAQSIHNYSNRRKQPFIAVNCAAIPENLLESELFGYEKGSFTGALKEGRKGLFEAAHNGTIFLDEIGDMSPKLQTKLLRVLQEKQISRVGSNEILKIDVRIIAATHKNLIELIQNNRFRADLYYRINVIPLKIPSLRERKEDILELLNYFLNEEKKFSKEAHKSLLDYDWLGNVRELENAAKYIQLMTENRTYVECSDLPEYICKDGMVEMSELELKTSIKLKILKLIYESTPMNKSTGRKYIQEKLDIKLTESQIRKNLENLKKEGLIQSEVGRAGSKLTEYGMEWMETNS